MKSFLRKTKASKSTLRRIEIILRRGDYKRRRTIKKWRCLSDPVPELHDPFGHAVVEPLPDGCSESTPNQAKEGSTPLQRFTALLGEDAFLVPCEWGTKKPLVTYVERPFEGTKSPAYRAMFEAEPTNIAVYLGKASGGLCAIDFDADDLAAFLAANPKLAGTLQSRGSRGGMVWVRIEGKYPESCSPEHKRFEWRAELADSSGGGGGARAAIGVSGQVSGYMTPDKRRFYGQTRG